MDGALFAAAALRVQGEDTEARLEDAAGKLYAHSTTTCIILGG